MNTTVLWRIKRIKSLWNRALGSVAQRGVKATLARIAREFKRVPASDESLRLIPLDRSFEGVAFTASPNPRVSIVIPVHGKVAYTVACLRSIANAAGTTSVEIIVIDDASPDDTRLVLASVPGVHCISSEANLGFVHSCNLGARLSRGEYLLFLNNDTQVTEGWIDHMLQCFVEENSAGIVGSKLVYPDGRLQEAGGWVFSDGSAHNVGRFESRDASTYQYRRETDYVSGASLMIRREVFEQLGGFDTRYSPGYYEDTDLAFAVRAIGLRVLYEPRSVVIHFEGITSGTVLESGMKQYQASNRIKFANKWAAALSRQPSPRSSLDLSWNRYSRGHILVIDAAMPDPKRDSGSMRLVAMLRLLHNDGWKITFIPDDGRATATEIHQLGDIGVEVLRSSKIGSPLQWLRYNGKTVNAVLLSRHSVASQYVEAVRKYAPESILVFDTVDLCFVRERRAAEFSNNSAMLKQAATSQRSEIALVKQCDVTFVVSEEERMVLRQEVPGARIELLSNIHNIHPPQASHDERRDLLFIGGYGHPPNSDAMQWMASELLPALRCKLPGIQIHVIGDVPDEPRRDLALRGLTMHQRVDELLPWMETCLASLAPLRFGAGVKGKINSSMSFGLPVVATTLAVEGMHLRHGIDVLVADDADGFVNAVVRLASDGALWKTLSTGGIDNVNRYFSSDTARETLRGVFSPRADQTK